MIGTDRSHKMKGGVSMAKDYLSRFNKEMEALKDVGDQGILQGLVTVKRHQIKTKQVSDMSQSIQARCQAEMGAMEALVEKARTEVHSKVELAMLEVQERKMLYTIG